MCKNVIERKAMRLEKKNINLMHMLFDLFHTNYGELRLILHTKKASARQGGNEKIRLHLPKVWASNPPGSNQ